MQYVLSFLEGIITFLSPCLLPMLPVYLSYFAGGQEQSAKKTMKNALGFMLGFTMVFLAMGALAGVVGGALSRYRTAVNLITGGVVVYFGLSFLGVFRLRLFKGMRAAGRTGSPGVFSSVLFGIVFSVSWTPCVGAFLGSALMLAARQGEMLSGAAMLLLYSAGLGIPMVGSALLIDRMKSIFKGIKRYYDLINRICGILLVTVGVFMMTGLFGRVLRVLE